MFLTTVKYLYFLLATHLPPTLCLCNNLSMEYSTRTQCNDCF